MTDPRVVMTDVHIDAAVWDEVAENTRLLYDADVDPVVAYSMAVSRQVKLLPNVVVDGEVKGLEDVEGVPLPDLDDIAEGD